MSRLLTLICLFFFLLSCSDKPRINKNLIYSTLNDIIQQDTIFARIICSKFDKARIPSDIQSEFFLNDKKFIQEQFKNSINASVDTGRLFFYWRKKDSLEKSHIDTTCSISIFYHLTYPVFSKDLQTVVVGVTEDCDKCFLGGWSYTAVYKRQNGKWIRVKKYDEWIS